MDLLAISQVEILLKQIEKWFEIGVRLIIRRFITDAKAAAHIHMCEGKSFLFKPILNKVYFFTQVPEGLQVADLGSDMEVNAGQVDRIEAGQHLKQLWKVLGVDAKLIF